MLLLKPFFIEERGQIRLLYYILEWVNFRLKVSSLKTEYTVRHCVMLLF